MFERYFDKHGSSYKVRDGTEMSEILKKSYPEYLNGIQLSIRFGTPYWPHEIIEARNYRLFKWVVENYELIPSNFISINQENDEYPSFLPDCHHLSDMTEDGYYNLDEIDFMRYITPMIAHNGDIRMLIWAQRHGLEINSSCYEFAACAGHLRTMKWLKAKGFDLKSVGWAVCKNAINNRHHHVLKWAIENGCTLENSHIRSIIDDEKRDILLMVRERFPWDMTNYKYILENSKIALFKWLIENGFPHDETVCLYIAQTGNLELFKWARSAGCQCDEFVCVEAAKDPKRYDILRFAIENKSRVNSDICRYLARNGDLEMIKWARKAGCPWNENVCIEAAKDRKKYDILRFAIENKCPVISPEICSQLAANGDLEMLMWARKAGCPWDENVCIEASNHGHYDVLVWAHQNGCPLSCYAYYRASRTDPRIIEYLGTNGCPQITCDGQRPIIGTPWINENGHFLILEWLDAGSCHC